MGNYHARCGAGEKPEVVTPEAYLSLFGKIPHFNEVLASIRSREMSIKIIIQAISQLDSLYGVPARKSWLTTVQPYCFLEPMMKIP